MVELHPHLLNPRQHRPTEMLLPTTIGIGPIVMHTEPMTAGWYARIDVAVPALVLDEVWSCSHTHPTEGEAWQCAEDAAQQLAEEVIRAR